MRRLSIVTWLAFCFLTHGVRSAFCLFRVAPRGGVVRSLAGKDSKSFFGD